jgi:hypothetical protein
MRCNLSNKPCLLDNNDQSLANCLSPIALHGPASGGANKSLKLPRFVGYVASSKLSFGVHPF